MTAIRVGLAVAGVVMSCVGLASPLATTDATGPAQTQRRPPPARAQSDDRAAARELRRLENQSLIFPEERETYADAASAAWHYVQRSYQPSTGLIDSTSGYPYATIWDIGSGLGALYAGHELSLIDTAEYDRRIRRALKTLRGLDLFDGAAFNKVYSTTTGSMTGRDWRRSARGYGWSAVDIGRLLVWLRILALNQPQYRDDTAAVVGRLAMDRLIKGGYLRGEDLDAAGVPRRYQEGQIGYQQYAAQGFAAWNFSPDRALRWRENSVAVPVMGHPLLADLRGKDRLTSDPLILLGLEFGWDRETERLAVEFLAAQQERYRKTGQVTMAGEDAVGRPPYFFYYYSALTNGKDFALDAQDPDAAIEEPRWVSAKAAFAWHVLLPSAYTGLALRTVAPARTPEGWGSGVYERSGTSTGTLNINTAAIILTSALVHARGEPILR